MLRLLPVVFCVLITGGCQLFMPSKPPRAFHQQLFQPTSYSYSESSEYMIATQGYWTSLAAQTILEQGGNAIDAAVAASFAISVERPQSTGIGGGGFMVVYLPAQDGSDKSKSVKMAVDFREKAPLSATKTMYQDPKGEVVAGRSTDGYLAVAIPGLVAGVLDVFEKYGSKNVTLAEVMAPAIHLAEHGFTVYPHLAAAIKHRKEVIVNYPASRAIFLKDGDRPYEVGDLFVQADLAKTLKHIAKNGRGGFYQGWVAEALVKVVPSVSQKDLDQYSVKYREPSTGSFRGYEIISMPPPSSGGVHLIQMLNILENFPLKDLGPYSPDTIHLTASAMQRAYADRSQFLGDPDFYPVPSQGLMSKPYGQMLAEKISKANGALRMSEVQPGEPGQYESDETTHFTIIDRYGNVVSSTQTINGWLGSGVTVPGTGIVLNNEMDDFSAKPEVPNQFGVTGGVGNSIVAEKRPLSSMTPTIVLKDLMPVLALGTPAGSRIITCVLLTTLNYLEYEMGLFDAVSSPRYHHQWTPDWIEFEPFGLVGSLKSDLETKGHNVAPKEIGCKIQAIARKDNGDLIGVSDPRGEGLSIGGGNEIHRPPQFVPTGKEVTRD